MSSLLNTSLPKLRLLRLIQEGNLSDLTPAQKQTMRSLLAWDLAKNPRELTPAGMALLRRYGGRLDRPKRSIVTVKPDCYAGCGNAARPGSRFCSNRCALAWAEELSIGNGDEWCPECLDWKVVDFDAKLICRHPARGIRLGGIHSFAVEAEAAASQEGP